MTNKINSDVQYRDIAKMLCRSLPVEEADFTQAVEDSLKAVKKLNAEAKLALKMAYIFSRKAPKAERDDLFQELALELLKSKRRDEKLCYAVARCDWKDWYKAFVIRQHLSLNTEAADDDGNTCELGDLIIGECEFEAKECDKLDAHNVFKSLPANIQKIVSKRLQGMTPTGAERVALFRWLAVNSQNVRQMLVTA